MKETLEVNRATIKDLLESKSALKQDVAERAKETFLAIKKAIEAEVHAIKPTLQDERIRLNAEEKGDHEIKVMIGSDAVVFQMHSNVFLLEDDNEAWEGDYLKNEPKNAYFGVIHIYNFLADSFIHNRMNDSGFLIGRIFINHENHLMVEGKGQLGFLFKDPETTLCEPEILKHIVQTSFAHALDFDLLSPPFGEIEEISLGQILAISADLQLKTSKRLGFKQMEVKKSS